MRCYQHRDQEAIGLCKSCQKAVCPVCVKDTGRGLACGDECAREIGALNQIVDRSKQIYGISSKSKLPAPAVLFFMFFGLTFTGFGVYPLTQHRNADLFQLIMGIGFILFGVMAFIRLRKLQINC